MVAAPRPDALRETYDQLFGMTERRSGGIPRDTLVRHVLSITEGADFRVRREAMEALLRRIRSVGTDDLVGESAAGYLGVRQTRRKGKRNGARPYTTLLRSIDPPAGSCDCPDYTKSSLGLCKHLLAIVVWIHGKDRFAQAAAEQRRRTLPAARVFWDPVRPLDGPGDWMAQIRLVPGTRSWPGGILTAFTAAAPEGLAPAREVLETARPRQALVEELTVLLESRAYHRLDPEPDPALAALLAREGTRAARRSSLPSSTRDLASLDVSLYPYQVEAVEAFLARGHLLLADDMGLGKTAQAIAIAHVLHHSGRVRRGLIVAPASLGSQWQREWRRFTHVPVEVAGGPREDRTRLYGDTRAGFLIVSYEVLLRDTDDLLAFDPELIILDEAQRMRNWATKTAKTIKRFDPSYRLVLTGTPMQNRLDELASVVEWLDDRALEPQWRLVPWHTEVSGDGARGVAGARHLDTLRERLSGVMLRRLRRDVLSQLPARTDTHVPVEMTERQRSEHDALTLPIRRILAVRGKRPLTHEEFLRLMRLLNQQRMISNALAQVSFDEVWPAIERRRPVPPILETLDSPKLLELRELIQNLVIAQGRKVVVFSEWRRMLRLAGFAISDLMAESGLRAVFFTGAESRKLRDQSLVELSDDPATRVMFLTDAGGVGLNLQRAANACINLELPWNPAVLEQRIGRIHRLGQEEPVDVYNLVATTGIEARIERIVRNKRQLFDAVFDGTTDEVRFDESQAFLERLEIELQPEAEDDDDEEVDVAIPPDAEPAAPSSPFERVRVERTSEGGVRIEAPPGAAEELAAMFEGMARLFRSAEGGRARTEPVARTE
jgi:superfamily II DNA or RNA helicase